jgi:hypothetical protein
MREQTKYRIGIFAAVVVGFITLTRQSFWIDEGAAALKAMQPTVHDWWQALRIEGHSNLQLIFQLFYLWGWEKIFGASEYALRASNVPWLAVTAVALVWGFPRKTAVQFSILFLTLTNAFVWYYMSEARPYIILLAFSSIATACLLRLVQDHASPHSAFWFGSFCVGLLGLCTTSIIAVPWAIGAVLGVFWWLGPKRTGDLLHRFRYVAIGTFLLLSAVGTYYCWTLYLGARASDVGRTGIKNILFVLYELGGLSGLGPGRLALRSQNFAIYRPFLPLLALGTIAIASVGITGLTTAAKTSNRRTAVLFGLAAGLPLVVVFAAGHFARMRLLGRHLTPLLPFVLAILAIGFDRLFKVNRLWSRAIAAAAAMVLVVSALEIRFAPRHERDDYRSAATAARQALAEGNTVWWLADDATGHYYGLSESAKLVPALRILEADLNSIAEPDVIFLSKPDIYDPEGKVSRYLRANDFKVTAEMPAFQIFERPVEHPVK